MKKQSGIHYHSIAGELQIIVVRIFMVFCTALSKEDPFGKGLDLSITEN
jgi:hypothetical protein